MDFGIINTFIDYMDMFPVYENPIYIPKKHTIMSYRKQQRLAKKRRRAK